MKTIIWVLEWNWANDRLTGEIEVEDDASPAEIEEEVRDAMWDRVSLTWEIMENE